MRLFRSARNEIPFCHSEGKARRNLIGGRANEIASLAMRKGEAMTEAWLSKLPKHFGFVGSLVL